MDADPRTDDELAQAAAAGDEAAFAGIFERDFATLYDYAIRLTKSRDLAALVVQASFVGAYGTLSSPEPRGPFKLQLLANAHYDAGNRLRGHRGEPPAANDAFDEIDSARLPDGESASDLPAVGKAAWQAALASKLDEYELLDLNQRRGLDAAEIAATLRTRSETVQGRLERSRQTYEQAFSAALLFESGRRACVDLGFVIGDETELSAGAQRRVAKHLETCQTCAATRARYPSALAALAALALIAAPAGWQETILARLREATRSGQVSAAAPVVPPPGAAAPAPVPVPAAAVAAGGGGFGGWLSRTFGSGSRGPLIIVLTIGVLIIALVLGGLCAAGAFDSDSLDVDATATSTASATPTVTETPTVTATATEEPTSIPPTAPPTATPAPSPTAPPTAPPTQPPEPTDTPRPSRTAEP
jgi:DNA-directed RNA polymerase specialized sigma24 family protein